MTGFGIAEHNKEKREMPDERLCAEHSGKIGTLEGTVMVALPAIEKRLAAQDELIIEIHKCVKGDNGAGIGEIARGTAKKVDEHLASHRFYWRNVIIVLVVGIITGVSAGMVIAALAK
jgi:hypothetical protein